MDEQLRQALAGALLGMADDELILGHRNSEWTGHAPILEEDIAFANIAQDELGHAGIWLGLRCDLTGEDRDRLVFFRDPTEFRNVQMVEWPKGDWAFTMLRQFLFDLYEGLRLGQMISSSYQPIAEAAAKIQPEELYHFRHTRTWIQRLGLGTSESNRRMQWALAQLMPLTEQLFRPMPGEALLVEAGILPEPADLREAWRASAWSILAEVGLQVPPEKSVPIPAREAHTPYLDALLADMQQVARADPLAAW